ncbi:MAG: FAD-dependent oxidoreductase [Burkholderiales bacterium]|nr:FAD-dependent oxidoreductase [Burkholderiales bacterium]
MKTQGRQRIAVIGAGISGLSSAYFLARKHDVVLFESGSYLGGHTNTVDVTLENISHPVDTGFLVFNDATYPNLIALFAELGVENYATDMSFGVSFNDGDLEWAGKNLNTVFAQRRNIVSPKFYSMLRDILRFNARSQENLTLTESSGATLSQLLIDGGYSVMFRDAYLLPMAAAIWSSSPADILKFPACTFLRFCLNHGLLQINNRPLWRTVRGGGREYVRKIAATLPDCRVNCEVRQVQREPNSVIISTRFGSEQFDAVIFATHAPQTLQMLTSTTENEREILSAIRYQPNSAILHTDDTQMPIRHSVWSSWNYLSGTTISAQRPACVSYWLNQLQALPFNTPLFVTLNPYIEPDPRKILARFEYEHPVFDQPAITAQKKLQQIQGKNRTWFAGAWNGYGFHEDGLKSALTVAADFNVLPAWAKV